MVNLTTVFPTQADCKNIDKKYVALHYHFILCNKQITINECGGYAVMCNGWLSKYATKFNAGSWYTVKKFDKDHFSDAVLLFKKLCVELIADVFYSYADFR